MWRGSSCSTVLHGAVILLLLFGLPTLPIIFERASDAPDAAFGGTARQRETPPIEASRMADRAFRPPGFDLPAIEVSLVPESALAAASSAATSSGPIRPAATAAAQRERPASPPGRTLTSDRASAASSELGQTALPLRAPAPTQRSAVPQPAADELSPAESVPLKDVPRAVAALDRRLRDATRSVPGPATAAERRRRTLTLARIGAAATHGHPLAGYNHAVLLLKGLGGRGRAEEAVARLMRAAERNYVPAQMLLGWFAAGGGGLRRDLARADFWWSLAEQRGSAAAARARALLKPHLAVEDVVQAQRHRAEWHALMRLVAPATAADTGPETLDERLRSAAEQGDASEVISALMAGADADARDRFGRNAIINAAWRGREQIVALILEYGVEADVADDRRRTPLIWGAINGHLGVVERLLAAGADPDRRDSEGATALIRAAWNGHPALVERLIAAGARLDTRDASGATALDRARQSGNGAIVRRLESARAAAPGGN